MLITFLVSFNIKSEVSAVIRIALVSTISLIFAVIIQKLVGLKYGLEAEYRIWAFREYTKPPKSFLRAIEDFFYDYTGILIPLAVFLITNAFWPFLAIASFIIKRPLKIRTGRFPFIKEKEVSAVAFFGVLSYLFVGLILNMFAPSGLIETKIPFLLALYSLIPLPNLPGSKIFFGGRITYIFTLAVTLSLFIDNFNSLCFNLSRSLLLWNGIRDKKSFFIRKTFYRDWMEVFICDDSDFSNLFVSLLYQC